MPSVSGDCLEIYSRDHTYRVTIGGDSYVRGRWHVEGRDLVTQAESLRGRERAKIVAVSTMEMTTTREGKTLTTIRMRCPRCDAPLGSFATQKSFPTERAVCPVCGLKLKDH